MEANSEASFDGASPLSIKDSILLVLMSTIGAVIIGIIVYGKQGLIDGFTNSDMFEVLSRLLAFAAVICLISYILVRLAAHYFVYLAISILLALLDPVNPRRARRNINRLFHKDKEN